MAIARPLILVLAGVNGAGKSSVGGALLADAGLTWFNPDTYARALVAELDLDIEDANGRAWEYGRNRLQSAMDTATSHAFETTLGGGTLSRMLAQASLTHDIVMIFCGLISVEHHLARVRARVAVGGHDIPRHKIQERWDTSRANLIRLLPVLTRLQVFDNSTEVAQGEDIPDPLLLLEMIQGRITFPAKKDLSKWKATPEWAKPILQAAVEISPSGRSSPGRNRSS